MWLYKLLGLGFVALAGLGVILPVLPTTPFLLVAAACFARSSPEWHARLLANKLFGPLLVDWQQRRCVSLKTKLVSVVTILLSGGLSVAFLLSGLLVQLFTVLLLAVGLTSVLSLKTCEDCELDINRE